MSLSNISYADRIRKAGYGIYRICEADQEGNTRSEIITPANPMQNCYSIAKAFSVLAVGICCDRGLLSADDKLCDLLPKEMKPAASRDPRWADVTLHHCLSHTVGYGKGCLDIDQENASLWQSRDYFDLATSFPLLYAPGEKRVYSDAAYYFVSRAVSSVTNCTLLDFIRPILMNKMHFRDLAWSTCPNGFSMGATGLFLHTEDMIKLGVLWLRRGDWFGERIVSEKWLKIAMERQYDCYRYSEADGGWYGKSGMCGQMLAFNPTLGRAVAWHAYSGKIDFKSIVSENP